MAGPAAVVRLGVFGAGWWFSTPPRAVWLTLPERERIELE